MGLMMIPDTALNFLDRAGSFSRLNYFPDHVFDSCFEGIEDFSDILHGDQPFHIDDDLLNGLDTDFFQSALDDDECRYPLIDDPYQEKLNAAAVEAAAIEAASFRSTQVVFFSPELLPIVNPNEVFNHIEDFPDCSEDESADEFQLNNPCKEAEKHVKSKQEVHHDHPYFKEKIEVKVEIKQEVFEEEEEEEEIIVHRNVFMKIETPAVKRPVGRPRKNPIASKPIKRSAAHFDGEANEEFVDVESIDVKRPRKAPKAKAAKAPAKKAAAKRKAPPKAIQAPSHFQAIDPLNPNGYAMRQAKTSALKKITKTKKAPTAAVSRSKRSDHNDMERKRRHEMRDLFEELKVMVPTDLLVDDNNKIKKNPSKNTILVGSKVYCKILYRAKKWRNSLVRQKQKFLKKHRKVEKSLKKICKQILSRRKALC